MLVLDGVSFAQFSHGFDCSDSDHALSPWYSVRLPHRQCGEAGGCQYVQGRYSNNFLAT